MPGQARFGNLRFTWIRPPSEMAANCRAREARFDPAVLARMSTMSEELLSWMQVNHPWTNRTGDAEAKLGSNARITGKGSVTLTAFHGVPYGGFLETGTVHNVPYPVLKPGLEAHYGQTRQIMNEIAGSS